MKKAFTLIELLVVVSIIGILSTLLMPSLSKAREKAKQAVCMSNVRQLGLATATYASDNDDYAPTHSNTSYWHQKMTQNGYLKPMAGDPSKMPSILMHCPAAEEITSKWDSNIGLNKYYSTAGTPRRLDGAQLNKTFIFVDSYSKSHIIYGLGNTNQVYGAENKKRMVRHLGKANILFSDIHAESVKAEYLLAQESKKPNGIFWVPQGVE